MICIDHDDVLPTYERQLPSSCPPSHKVNLQPDTGCALGGAGDSLSVLEQYSMPDAQIPWLYEQSARWSNLFITSIHALFIFLQDMLRGECDKKQSCHMCCVCVGNLHLLVNTCK